MVMSPAAQCVGGTSRTTTRTFCFGASTAATTASVSAVMRARNCSGERPSTRVTSTSGTSAALQHDGAERGEVRGDGVTGLDEHRVGHAPGEHQPAGLERDAAAAEVVGGQRQRLTWVPLHG